MKKKICFLWGLLVVVVSCGNKKTQDLYSLQPANTYLNFSIDNDTRLPRYCLWTFEEKGKEYLCFPNIGREILFYSIEDEKMVKKVVYQTEGDHGVGMIDGFFPVDFNHIYIASSSLPVIYATDSTGQIKSKVEYYETTDKQSLVPALINTITYSPMFFLGDSLYLPQTINSRLGDHFISESPLGVVINLSNKQITATPLKFALEINDLRELPYSTTAGKVSTCFDGERFIYSDEMQDSIVCMSRNFKTMTKFLAKSKYMKHPKSEVLSSDATIDEIIKRKCELPTYGNLIYDKYRQVYYRFVFPEVSVDDEKNFMDIYHNGRKQFSIIILDKKMNMVGETLFPEYCFNPYLFFVSEDGLYISISHFKRPDFNENTLRFQKIELLPLSN